MEGHWHVAVGLAGYRPDGSDGFRSAVDFPALADLIADELREAADLAHDDARIWAREGLFEMAWKEQAQAERLRTLADAFDNARAQAPLYRGAPGAWDEAVREMAVRQFPLDISRNARLHVWPCKEGAACEHLNEG